MFSVSKPFTERNFRTVQSVSLSLSRYALRAAFGLDRASDGTTSAQFSFFDERKKARNLLTARTSAYKPMHST